MGNMLLDMMGLLTRKKVTKTGEDQDFLVLGRTPKLDVDMMFTAPKMHNELIRLKDLKAYFDVGEISGSGSERTIPMFTASGDSIENSQLSQSPPLSNGLYQMKFDNCDRFFINKPSSVTDGDPEFLIKQDNDYKVSFGWDDDGAGFGYIYNWAGGGLRLGAQGQDPHLELDTTNSLIISHTDHNFNENIIARKAIQITGATTTDTGIKWIHPAGGNSDEVFAYFSGAAQGSRFVISREAAGGAEIELQAGGDINLNRTGNGKVLVGSQLDMDSNKIVNLLDPTDAQDAATKAYVDANVSSGSSGIQETTGSWTPIVGTTDPADFVISSYQIQQGHWVRHGNLVTVDFTIQALASNVSAASGSTSALFIHGWPFDALGAGSSIQAPFLDFVDGFDVEVKSTTINTTNDPAIIGGLRLLLMKQHPGVTNYVAFQNLYAGEFTNGNYFRIFGSMTYYTTNTTLNTGATQLP